MRKIILIGLVVGLMLSLGVSWAQKDKDEEPTSWLYFSVVKDDNGKPVRNAAVILHPVSEKGKQERGGIELKTSPEGKCDFDGVPFGTLRVQVLAHGYQTYGDDFEISKAKTDITIKLKRPQGQFSIYDDQAKNPTPRQETAPDDSKDKKPN